MKMRKLSLALVAIACLVSIAADWPQWRGPKRDGTAADTGLLKEWPAEGPKLVWQIKDVGFGFGAPAVVGERLYLISNTGNDNEFAQALDIKNGKQVWTTKLGNVGEPKQFPPYPGARSTPTVDGDRLYALGSDGDIVCLDTAGGKEVWRKNLRTDFGGKPGVWAYSESPLVDGDVLVCTPGGKDATLVALNKKSGEVIWKAAVPGGDAAGYASVIPVEAAGVKQYVQFLGRGVAAVDAKTGEFLWRFDGTGKGPANMATPVAHDGLIFTTNGYVGGATVKVEKSADGKLVPKQLYLERGLPTSIGGSVLVDGHLYGTTPAGLVCAEFATGKSKWKDKCIGAGSTLYADGRLYIHGENNMMALVEATPEGYREKGKFKLPEPPEHAKRPGPPEVAWTYPVLANGRLYVRDLGTIWCYDVKGQ